MTRLIFLFLSVGILLQLKAHHRHVTLQQALDLHLVKAGVNSLGGHQGFCMQVQVKNLCKDSLILTIEAGRRLNSKDDSYQDILIVKEEVMALRSNQEKTMLVKGYCCQAKNRCPNPQIKYTINTMADSNLVKLSRYLSVHPSDQHAEQEAVWALSENRSAANIATVNDSLLQALRTMVADLRGEILPWYRLVSKPYVGATGIINNQPYLLQGELIYTNDQADYVTLSIKNEKGLAVCLIKTQWLKSDVNAVYKLDLPIGGLEKGKYVVELKAGARELSRREFVL